MIGIVLLARGVVLELLLLTGGVAASVGPSETHWSLVLWNPWFMLGGTAFLLVAFAVGRSVVPEDLIAGDGRDRRDSRTPPGGTGGVSNGGRFRSSAVTCGVP